MSKTAREVIADCLLAHSGFPSGEYDIEKVFQDIDAAGFVIVPKEPTPEMIDAGNDTDNTIEAMSDHPDREEQIANIYRAMIAKAQQP